MLWQVLRNGLSDLDKIHSDSVIINAVTKYCDVDPVLAKVHICKDPDMLEMEGMVPDEEFREAYENWEYDFVQGEGEYQIDVGEDYKLAVCKTPLYKAHFIGTTHHPEYGQVIAVDDASISGHAIRYYLRINCEEKESEE